jgi:PAS domain S-box-containing protein
VIELYPDDPDLTPLGAVSYMGVPLLDTDGTILGHVAILHDEPMPEDPSTIAVFNIFAGRAAAELRRLRRDRHLRDREQKLSRLIDSAMDAIIELDGDLTINHVNSAAEKAFGCSAEEMAVDSFAAFLSKEACAKLVRLMAELERQPEGSQSLWIPDGLDAIRSGGDTFAAEATVSRFEMNGQSLFALILRNISERQEAEERIRSLIDEAEYLRDEIEALQPFDDIIGESDALRRVLVDVEHVAGSDTTVLITGETGTGKELIARAIHQRSTRSGRALIKVNCAAIPSSLQESEFFGHEQGAFTGATRRRDGRFKLADGGTIFLDEVGELPLDLQAKLLRVLQEGEYEPVGASKTERVDVRVITATNRDLEAMVDDGTFRKDLLYRLNVFPMTVPPLRERDDDVVMLAAAFARTFARRNGRPEPTLTADDRAKLRRYDWPGNVRELQNVVERAFITARDGRLNLARALPDTAASAALPASENAVGPGDDRILTVTEMRDLECANIVRALEASRWKISGSGGAAELLGLNANTLSSRMKALGIEGPRSS